MFQRKSIRWCLVHVCTTVYAFCFCASCVMGTKIRPSPAPVQRLTDPYYAWAKPTVQHQKMAHRFAHNTRRQRAVCFSHSSLFSPYRLRVSSAAWPRGSSRPFRRSAPEHASCWRCRFFTRQIRVGPTYRVADGAYPHPLLVGDSVMLCTMY